MVVTARAGWVLDTGALLAYASADERVGQVIADAADLQVSVAVPVLCLVEAYRILEHDEHSALGPLRAHASVLTIPVELSPDDSVAIVGSMARTTGRLGAAHAVFTAMAHGAAIVTSQPDQVRTIVGDGWPVIDV